MFFVFIANRSPTLTSFKIWKTRLEQTPFWRLKFLRVGLCDRQPSRETLCLSSWTHTPVCSQPQWMKAGLGNQEELQKYPKAGSPKTSGLLSCCSGSLSLGEVKGHDLTLQHCGEVCGEGNWKEPCVCVCVCVCVCARVCVCVCVSPCEPWWNWILQCQPSLLMTGVQTKSCKILEQNGWAMLLPNSWPNSLS